MSEANETAGSRRLQQPGYPMQPIVRDDNGTIRFRANRIIEFLLAAGPFDLNQLAAMPFDADEREQFAQLIGYSVSGFGELSYVSDEAASKADEIAAEIGG